MVSQTRSTAERVALVVLAAFAVLLVAGPIARLPYLTELPNEGWNAIHALHAFSRDLYPKQPAWIINNYPPLSFYLTGAVSMVTDDPIRAGRVIAMLAFLGTAASVFALSRALHASRAASLLAALTFVIIVAGLLGSYVGLNEPQMLAHAVMTASVAVAIRAERRPAIALAALGVVVAIFIKPIVIALPLAATVWLLIHRRKLARIWIATGAITALAALSACIIAYGSPFIANLTFPRTLTLERLGTNLALASKAVVALVAFAWIASRSSRRRDPAVVFVGLAVAGGFLEILMFGAALGVSVNIALDLVIAAALGAGVAYDGLGASRRPVLLRSGLVAALILRVVLGMPDPIRDLLPAGRADLRAQQQAIETVVATLNAHPGPVACEALSACVWAGRASEADFWKIRFETTLRSLDQRGLLDEVKRGRFAAIVTYGNFTSPADDRNFPGLYDALGAWYEPAVKAGTAFLIFPRKSR